MLALQQTGQSTAHHLASGARAHELVHAPLMSSALEARGRELARERLGQLAAEHALTEAQHVRVVVRAGHPGAEDVADHRGPDPGDAVGGHRHPLPGPAHQQAARAVIGEHPAADLDRDIRVISLLVCGSRPSGARDGVPVVGERDGQLAPQLDAAVVAPEMKPA